MVSGSNIQKIAVVTGSRADYGLLLPLLKILQKDRDLELQLIVCASHLSYEFGYTRRYIEQDGFEICADVEMLVSGDTPVAITKSVGLGCIGFADCLNQLSPDLLVLLGDRYEILAAAQSAMFARIPIAHIHGGEVTEGAIDDCIRHAITKMSYLHFVATDEYKKRVIQLGEEPCRVHNVGAIGLDNLAGLVKPEKSDVERQLGAGLSDSVFLVTFHPETLSDFNQEDTINCIFDVLDCWPDASIVVTGSNSDEGGAVINKAIHARTESDCRRFIVRSSLGHKLYLELLSICDCVIGNSSSGIIEAPSCKVPTVNIGDRQKGRVKAASIIDCENNYNSIKSGVQKALSKSFIESIENIENPYGNGKAASKIVEILKDVVPDKIIIKQFFNV